MVAALLAQLCGGAAVLSLGHVNPPPGAPCDLAACACGGVSLAGLKARGVVEFGPDGEGYSYKLSFCGEIPAASLPTGCQNTPPPGVSLYPATVKFKADNLADCIEVGSVGPCSQGSCGMTGVKTPTGVDVTYTYTYGCTNTFSISLSPGNAAAPGAVTSNGCSYSTTWSALGPPPAQVRCVNNTCVPAPVGAPGMDNATCAKACGPVSACALALLRDCGATRAKGGDAACMYCAGAHQAELHAAGCAPSAIAGFCSAAPAPPAPPPPVECSAKGSCFNISGAHNYHPTVPSGTDLNGQYAKTAQPCNGKDVWQKGGGGGPVLFYDGDGGDVWFVGPSERATDCSVAYGNYLWSGEGSCPSSPDGAGCAGKWAENDSSGGGQDNPALRVVASGGR
jgi:hypothetical protein